MITDELKNLLEGESDESLVKLLIDADASEDRDSFEAIQNILKRRKLTHQKEQKEGR